jgi:hypothetical protein
LTLGGGIYGPPLKTEHVEKQWPPTKTNRSIYSVDLKLSEIWDEKRLTIWLLECKYYGAEWQEEQDDWIDYCSNNINSYD